MDDIDTSREAVEREWAGIREWVELGPISWGDLSRARRQTLALLDERDAATLAPEAKWKDRPTEYQSRLCARVDELQVKLNTEAVRADQWKERAEKAEAKLRGDL